MCGEEVDVPSNCNNKDGLSRKRTKKKAIEDYSDASKCLNLEISPTDNTHPTDDMNPTDNIPPLDGLAAKSPLQTNEPSSKASDNAMDGHTGHVEMVEADYAPTSNDNLCNMSCESYYLQHNRRKKVLLATRIGLKTRNEHLDYDNVEVHSKCIERNNVFPKKVISL